MIKMFDQKINLKIVIILILISILMASGTTYILAQTPTSTFTISPGIYPGAPTYTVWREGNFYYAKDSNGVIKYSGTDADVIINNVIDDNRLIFLLKGTFLLSDTLDFRNHENVILQGEGWGTVLKITTEIDPIIYIGGRAIGYAEGITIRNLAIDGAEIGTTVRGILVGYASQILIDHVYIRDCSRYSLSVLHTPSGRQYIDYLPRHVIVQNSLFEGFSGQQMENVLFGGIGNIFRNNEIRNSPKRALAVYDDTYNRSYGIIIQSNYIHDNVKDGIFVHVPSVIENNVLVNNLMAGIKIQPNGEQMTYEGNIVLPIKGVVVRNNYLYNNTNGIFVICSDAITIDANVVYHNQYQGIGISVRTLHGLNINQHLEGFTISNNIIYENGRSGSFNDGIYFHTEITGINISDVLVIGNQIFATKRAIRFEVGDYYAFRIISNYFSATTVISQATGANITDIRYLANIGLADN